MVGIHYRWDFIGLSTDQKPTPQTSEKVVNGSTFYCSDNSKLYVFYNGTWYERKPLGGGGGGGTSDFNDLSNRPKYNGSDMTGSTNIPEVKTYTAGSNVAISDQNVISATDTTYTAGTNVSISDQNVISATDTTYSAFTGTDGTAAGTAGLVPAPATTDAGKFLKADGTWDTAGSAINVVQTTGTSTTDVMSQDATTKLIYHNYDATGTDQIAIGNPSPYGRGSNSIVIGLDNNTRADGDRSIAIGCKAEANMMDGITIASGTGRSYNNGSAGVVIGCNAVNANSYSVSLGDSAITTRAGEVNVGAGTSGHGYASSNYRVIGGVYDGVDAHDAATVGQLTAYSVVSGAGAPTTSTAAQYVGQFYYDTTNDGYYYCTAITAQGTTPETYSYTWTALSTGGSGPTVVQTTGTSTTDVMSQNAVTSMVFADPSTRNKVQIGNNSTVSSNTNGGVAIGKGSSSSSGAIAFGNGWNSFNVAGAGAIGIGSGSVNARGAISLGAFCTTNETQGVMQIGTTDTNYGYNSSNYRLLTGLYDPQSDHDAATKGYVDPTTDSSAPTTATVGRLGQIQIDTTTATAYMCVAVDTVTPAYTWKQITA